MLVKIRVNQTQKDALTQFVESDENKVSPPEGWKFAEALGRGRATYLAGCGGVPVASIYKVGNHVTWFSITIEVKEYVPMLEEHDSVQCALDEKTQYVFPFTILEKLFAAVNRFPSEGTTVHPYEKEKFKALR